MWSKRRLNGNAGAAANARNKTELPARNPSIEINKHNPPQKMKKR
jgi:hypothetical protein